jgi:hypothetical protein
MSNGMPEEATIEKQRSARPLYYSAIPESGLVRKTMRSLRMPEPVQFEFTQDAGLIHQYCVMREHMFISVWGLKHFSGTKDRFDDASQLMVARRGLQVIAGGRLTISTPAGRLAMPMEGDDLNLVSLFPDLELARRTYGEFSRLAILPEFRAGNVFPELAKRFIRKAVAEGVDYAFNMAPVPLARSYRQTMQSFGLSWKIRSDVEVPERDEFEGIKMVLSVMDLRPLRGHVKPAREALEQGEMQPILAD